MGKGGSRNLWGRKSLGEPESCCLAGSKTTSLELPLGSPLSFLWGVFWVFLNKHSWKAWGRTKPACQKCGEAELHWLWLFALLQGIRKRQSITEGLNFCCRYLKIRSLWKTLGATHKWPSFFPSHSPQVTLLLSSLISINRNKPAVLTHHNNVYILQHRQVNIVGGTL